MRVLPLLPYGTMGQPHGGSWSMSEVVVIRLGCLFVLVVLFYPWVSTGCFENSGCGRASCTGWKAGGQTARGVGTCY